ncbi:T9SS type A sorting domain-containing protein [Parabacteroides sp. PF5-6]|uniref:T9SS type A sorting domain-containing protein n=1 Tax=Parabacteroides sp. PF5-6 TaxID=1742403 RepID=UPI00240545FF|nr:T9SS type A sorting domain-containing protein [Parabacteroides sp. PF5-6]MDF9828899.1 hypothetical protein [Parabacteroides sp. PF5-6]
MKRFLRLTMLLFAIVAGKTMAAEPDLVINNLEELKAFRDAVNQGNTYFEETISLNANIDLEGENWIPIGETWASFSGTFKGQGYTIKGLHINKPYSEELGLFGHIESDGRIENLHIELHENGIIGKSAMGGLTGYNKGTITGCSVTTAAGGSITGSNHIGGLAGSNNGNISNSYAAVPVKLSGTDMRAQTIGGLTSLNGPNASISDCYATGEVTIDSSDELIQAGGLVGYNGGTIENAFTTSRITVVSTGINPFVGAFIGMIDKETESKITDCGFLHSGNIDEEPLGVAGCYDNRNILYTSDTYPETLSTNIKARINVAPTAKDPVPTQEIIGTGTISFTAADIADDDDWDKLKIVSFPVQEKAKCINMVFNKKDGVVTLTGIAPGEGFLTVIVTDLVGKSVYVRVPIKVLPEETSSIYHTISLVVGEGIDCNYATGSLTVAEGDHLFLQFSVQEYGLTADDMLFLIDGVETAFNVTIDGKGGNYILNPIEKDQSIEIRLRDNTTDPDPNPDTTANADLAAGTISIAVSNYQLSIINSGDAVNVSIYTITGKNVVSLRALRGSKTFPLPAGIYIVRAGNQTIKVRINN